jgi:hypothetical protein
MQPTTTNPDSDIMGIPLCNIDFREYSTSPRSVSEPDPSAGLHDRAIEHIAGQIQAAPTDGLVLARTRVVLRSGMSLTIGRGPSVFRARQKLVVPGLRSQPTPTWVRATPVFQAGTRDLGVPDEWVNDCAMVRL